MKQGDLTPCNLLPPHVILGTGGIMWKNPDKTLLSYTFFGGGTLECE